MPYLTWIGVCWDLYWFVQVPIMYKAILHILCMQIVNVTIPNLRVLSMAQTITIMTELTFKIEAAYDIVCLIYVVLQWWAVLFIIRLISNSWWSSWTIIILLIVFLIISMIITVTLGIYAMQKAPKYISYHIYNWYFASIGQSFNWTTKCSPHLPDRSVRAIIWQRNRWWSHMMKLLKMTYWQLW